MLLVLAQFVPYNTSLRNAIWSRGPQSGDTNVTKKLHQEVVKIQTSVTELQDGPGHKTRAGWVGVGGWGGLISKCFSNYTPGKLEMLPPLECNRGGTPTWRRVTFRLTKSWQLYLVKRK